MPSPATLPADINRRVEALLRFGKVTAVDHAAGKCRVQTGGIETQYLPWLERREGTTNDWDPPTIDEECLVLSPSGETAGGVVLLGVPSDAHPQPIHDENFWKRVFPDETWIHHNHAKRHFHINLGSTSITLTPDIAIVKTPFCLIDAPLTELTGDAQIDGNLHVCKDVFVDGSEYLQQNDIAAGAQIDGRGNTNHHGH
jgi:phage baseplate assembly protein V